MARRGYLQRIVRRATAAAPVLRPARLIGGYMAAVESSMGESPRRAAGPDVSPVPAASPAQVAPRAEAVPPVAAPPPSRAAASPPVAPSSRARPSGPAEATSGGAQGSQTPQRSAEVPAARGARATPAATPPPDEPASEVQRREALRRVLPRRNVSAHPDPTALALAAALRWTSSDERADAVIAPPAARRDSDATVSSTARTADAAADRAVVATLQPAVPAAPPAAGFDITLRRPEEPQARAGTMPDRAAARERASDAPQPAAGGIHIGTVEVHIVPAPEAHEPRVAVPAAAPRATATAPLARGYTLPFGLRQS